MDYLNDILKSIGTLGQEMLMALGCIAIGYVVRMLPGIPNKAIPYICIFAPLFIYPFLTNPGRVSPDVQNPIVRIELTALLIGVLAWILHDKVIAHVEDKLEQKFPKLMKPLVEADEKDSVREVVKAMRKRGAIFSGRL